MSRHTVVTDLDLRGKTITTFILFEVHQALQQMCEGDRLQLTTDEFAAIDADIHAWCRATGHRLVDAHDSTLGRHYMLEKGTPQPASSHKLAAIISDDGLFELLSPLGFALAAALEGHRVSLFFEGPGVRVLARGYRAKMHGPARPFSRFPRRGLERAGHVSPHEKIRQLQQLGTRIYACGPSMAHFKVPREHLAFNDVTIAEYPTFAEQMAEADMHLVV